MCWSVDTGKSAVPLSLVSEALACSHGPCRSTLRIYSMRWFQCSMVLAFFVPVCLCSGLPRVAACHARHRHADRFAAEYAKEVEMIEAANALT